VICVELCETSYVEAIGRVSLWSDTAFWHLDKRSANRTNDFLMHIFRTHRRLAGRSRGLDRCPQPTNSAVFYDFRVFRQSQHACKSLYNQLGLRCHARGRVLNADVPVHSNSLLSPQDAGRHMGKGSVSSCGSHSTISIWPPYAPWPRTQLNRIFGL
jgi:hypothetical protein